jgi:hypothetical protein
VRRSDGSLRDTTSVSREAGLLGRTYAKPGSACRGAEKLAAAVEDQQERRPRVLVFDDSSAALDPAPADVRVRSHAPRQRRDRLAPNAIAAAGAESDSWRSPAAPRGCSNHRGSTLSGRGSDKSVLDETRLRCCRQALTGICARSCPRPGCGSSSQRLRERPAMSTRRPDGRVDSAPRRPGLWSPDRSACTLLGGGCSVWRHRESRLVCAASRW